MPGILQHAHIFHTEFLLTDEKTEFQRQFITYTWYKGKSANLNPGLFALKQMLFPLYQV